MRDASDKARGDGMKKLNFRWAALFSLAVFVCATGLWIHGIFRVGAIELVRGRQEFNLVWEGGYIDLQWQRPLAITGGAHFSQSEGAGILDAPVWPPLPIAVVTPHRFGGFGFDTEQDDQHRTWYVEMVAPCWFLMLLSAALPARQLRLRLRSRRRNQLRLCRACGYDLRASPGKCPECGTEPSSNMAFGGAKTPGLNDRPEPSL
jgi:hypothetical protein